MSYNVETAIIELETLTPLFIKGKDVNYGEGMLRGSDGNIYLIDNDKLCEYIAQKDKIDEYVKYFDLSANREISLKDFLSSNKIDPNLDELKNMSKGITKMSERSRNENKFIQNGNGKHFIPGSSIKGAIRNAVLWKILSEPSKMKLFKTFLNHHLPVVDDLISVSIKIDERDYEQVKNIINKSNFLKSKSILNNDRVDKDRFEKIKKPYKEHLSAIKDDLNNTVDSISYTALIPNKIISQDLDAEQKKYLEKFNELWRDANETLRDFFRIVKISDANFEGDVILKNEVAKAVCKDATKTPPESYQKKFQIPLECAQAKTKARFKISIDLNLAQDFFPTGIPFYLQSVSNLLKTVDEFFRAVADFEETQFYNGLISIPNDINPNDKRNAKLKVNTEKVYNLYKTKFGLTDDKLIFRTGWGGGFMSKTQFLHLTMPERVKIRDLVRFNGSPIAPKSRCLIVEGQNAITPLGWCNLAILPNGELPDINQAKITVEKEPQRYEQRQNNPSYQRGFQNKPATEKEIAQSKAETNKILKQAEKSKSKAVSYKKGDKIEMKVVESVPFKSVTLEKDGNQLSVETNKMKRDGEIVKVEVLEVKDGKITRVKLI